MDTISKIEHWADTHHPKWIDFLRALLGLFILYKGIMFISNTGALMDMMSNNDLRFFNLALAHYVAFAHLVGGFMIAIGLLTRFAIIFQIPILLGAVFFVNIDQGFLSVSNNLEFELSLLVLILLVVFLIFGSGKFSLDHWWKKHPHW